MPVTRRGFLRQAGFDVARRPPSGRVIAARRLEASRPAASRDERLTTPEKEIRISSNENPLGPGPAALQAIVAQFDETGRYPFNSTPSEDDLVDAVAAMHQVKAENVVLGAGSQEILRNAVRIFTAPGRGLITGSPSFENCVYTAKRLNHPITEVRVDSELKLDAEPMLAASQGGGLVYFNNPNNPTGTVHGLKSVSAFIEALQRTSPATAVLVDEAYHDYVTEPSYRTAIPLALELPNVFVTRTFSKVYGMAGLRIGYAIGRAYTIKRLSALKMPYNVSVLGIAAAMAGLRDRRHIERERARNTEVRAFTIEALTSMGCAPADAQGNFVFAAIGRPAREFREACARSGVMVGRDFPPFEKTHVRISLGTIEEMRRATEIFRQVLRGTTSAASGRDVEEPSC